MPKLLLSNPFAEKTLTVWIEPWGRDYWMRPGDVFAIDSEDRAADDDPPFEVSWLEDGIVVGVKGDSTVRDRGGIELECGHQRPVDLGDR
ncbi:hypothetical protein [Streptomyces roseolus]|uniref:hypothetical protein n=1 Tax=Streptomyces roseolus TaxID=67358 RepID=UPI0036562013